jgi:hypothetical protein
MQLSAAVGINRLLVLLHMLDIPLVTKTSDNTEDDSINTNHRQVLKIDYSVFFKIILSETFAL